MFHKFKRLYRRMAFCVLIASLLLASCQFYPAHGSDLTRTQDIGEKPPTCFTCTYINTPEAIVSAEPTRTEIPSGILVGPASYPTPGSEIVEWHQLVIQNLFADVSFHVYNGSLTGNTNGQSWNISFFYPSTWFSDMQQGSMNLFVQNIPLQQGLAPAEFIKFEITRLHSPPTVEPGNQLDLRELTTVSVSGEPGILFVNEIQPDQARVVILYWQHEGSWLVATGYITLSTVSKTAMDRYTAIIFAIISTISFT